MALTILRAASLAAIAVLAFLAWMHPHILDIRNVGWLLNGQDWGQNALGLQAYLNASDAWPATRTPLLSAPEGARLLLMDSNPLLGLVLKPFAPLLPAEAQFVGLWLALCLALHVGFATALLRRHAPHFLALWLGVALLTLLPTLFNRFGHPNLCAHWLMLWALWVFVEPRRADNPAWWAAVLGVAALVHSYLLLLVAAIWASSLLVGGVSAGAMRGRVRVLAGAALVAGWVVALISLHDIAGAGLASSGTYGGYAMSIDALWDPGNPSYSALLPSSSGNASRAFEGFQYLGAGLLLLCGFALIAALVMRREDRAATALPRLAWLVPAFVALTLLALGGTLYLRGAPVAGVALPPTLIDLLDPVRASGRLFWPVAYTLVFAAIVIVYRLRPKLATGVLAVGLALQIIDIAPMFAAIRAQTQARPTYVRTIDPRWEGLIAASSSVEFQPMDPHIDAALFQEIAWRAVTRCRPVRLVYSARISAVTAARMTLDAQRYHASELDPTRLYVLLDPAEAAFAGGRAQALDGVPVIPPAQTSASPTGCR